MTLLNLYDLVEFILISFSLSSSDDEEIVIHSDDAFAPVGYLNFKKLSLYDKVSLFIYTHTYTGGPSAI